MKKIFKRLCTGFLALATMLTALPTTAVHASEKQYWTTGKEKAGVIEKVMNDGSIGSTFNESWFVVEGETAYCIDINTDFISGYKTRADASTRMSDDQISDVALSLEYVKQYAKTHSNLNDKQAYLLEQCVVWQRLSVHLGWECDNVRASYDEIPKSVQDEVYTGAKAFVKENKGRYACGGYIYSGQGQELGQFWAKLAVGNSTLKKTSSNSSLTDGNGNYSLAGATYGVFSDKACNNQLATLTTDNSGNHAVKELLTYYDAERTAFSIINHYLRFVDEEAGKRKTDWKLNPRWAWFIGKDRSPIKLTEQPQPYTLERTFRWIARQVAPTLKMLKRIDTGNNTAYLKSIEEQARLTEKHKQIIKQQTAGVEELVVKERSI